jgi:hypothetical protein
MHGLWYCKLFFNPKAHFMKSLIHSITRFPVLGILFAVLIFTSCKKDNSISPEDEIATLESMENDATADFSYSAVTDDALDIAMEENQDYFGFQSPSTTDFTTPRLPNGRIQRCFTVVVDSTPGTVFPVTVTIDFKDGCVGRDGKTRKGKIITVYSGRMRMPGNKATTTFNAYFIDSINVDGTHILTNVSRNDIPAFKREVINGKLTWNSGRWVKWTAVRTVAMINGIQTPFDRKDDVFRITGEGRGENSRGKTWTHEITEGLIKKTICRWISSGVIRFRHNAAVGALNYGNGACDNKAILTVNGRSKEITLR